MSLREAEKGGTMGRIPILLCVAALTAAAPALAGAADGDAILKQQCAPCHALSKPSDLSLERLWKRKGPDLYYAGVKFNQQWLVQWLQNPARIRPAGEFYFKHVKMTPGGDIVDIAALPRHPRLSKADAEAAAAALMALKGPDAMVSKGAFKKQAVPALIGAMFFEKLRGCAACHMDKPNSGGLSGPELYDAGKRLQPDYIYAYIKAPQRFDPHIWMPQLDLSETDLQRLANYLAARQDAAAK
jgi:mono/diheme cytochrome c family protein